MRHHEQITFCGQTVDCYGEWKWDSNAVVVVEDENGDVWDTVFADGAENWYDAVQRVINAMPECKVIEMQAC